MVRADDDDDDGGGGSFVSFSWIYVLCHNTSRMTLFEVCEHIQCVE